MITARETYQIGLSELNKLISNNEQDVPEYIWVLEFNKQQLHYIENHYKLDERDKYQIHKIQKILVNKNLTKKKVNGNFSEFDLPDDYLRYSSSIINISSCPKQLEVHLFEEHNINNIIKDPMWKPSLKFEECPVTISNQKLNIYHLNEFTPESVTIHYYRYPVEIDIADGFNHLDGTASKDINPEWDDINTQEIIDLTVRALASSYSDEYARQVKDAHIKETQYRLQ